MSTLYKKLFYFFSSATWRQIGPADRRLFIAIMLVHVVLSGWYISRIDFTCDESAYYGWTLQWAKGHQDRVHPTVDSKTPITAPALLPNVVKLFVAKDDGRYDSVLMQAGRWMMYCYLLLGAFVLFIWAYRLWGNRKWVFPLLLLLFDPLVFSNGMLIGSDIAIMALLLTTCYVGWRYWQTREVHYWIRLCCITALTVMAKASMVFAVPLIMLMFFIAPVRQKPHQINFWFRWGIFILSIWFFILAAYMFQQCFFPFSSLPHKSHFFQNLYNKCSFLGSMPVPLPYHYVSSFDLLKYNAELGGGFTYEHSFTGVFLHGRYFNSGPVWYYYIYVFLFKWPIFSWGFFLFSLMLLRRKIINSAFLRRHIFLWLPVVVYGIILSCTNPFQIGMRHALVLMPFIYLLVGFAVHVAWNQYRKITLMSLLFYALSWLSFWPNLLSYTNELIWRKELVYQYFLDSNVIYCHGKTFRKRFIQLYPEYSYPGTSPAVGKFAVELETLAHPQKSKPVQWLLSLKKPIGHYMHVVLLYEVTEADLQNARSKVSGK